MSKFKQLSPGSPFQFRAPGQHLGPLLKDVRTARLVYNPSYIYRGRGMLANVIRNLEGRVHARLCPKTTIEYAELEACEPARLEVQFIQSDHRATYVLDERYRTMRDLMVALYDDRRRLELASIVRQAHTIVQVESAEAQITEPVRGSRAAAKK